MRHLLTRIIINWRIDRSCVFSDRYIYSTAWTRVYPKLGILLIIYISVYYFTNSEHNKVDKCLRAIKIIDNNKRICSKSNCTLQIVIYIIWIHGYISICSSSLIYWLLCTYIVHVLWSCLFLITMLTHCKSSTPLLLASIIVSFLLTK